MSEQVSEDIGESKAPRASSPVNWTAWVRDVIDHPAVGLNVKTPKAADPNRTNWQPFGVWFWMVNEATYKPRTIQVKGMPVFLQRGQLVLSERLLADKANWNRKSAYVFLQRLVRFDMVTLSTATRDGQMILDFAGSKRGPAKGPTLTIVTITNYNKYQHQRRAKGASEGADKGPTGGRLYTKNTSPLEQSNQSPEGDSQTEDQSIRLRGTDQTDEGSNVIPMRRGGMVMDPPSTKPYVIPAATLRKIETLGCDPEELLDRMNEQIDKGRPIGSRSRYLIQSAINEAHERTGASKESLKALISGNEFARQHAMQQIAGVALKTRMSDEQRQNLQRANPTVSNRSALAAALKR